jgi:hypothetical protein
VAAADGQDEAASRNYARPSLACNDRSSPSGSQIRILKHFDLHCSS